MKLNWEQDLLHPSCHEVQNHCNRRYEEIDRPVQDNEMEEVTYGRIVTLETWAASHATLGLRELRPPGNWATCCTGSGYSCYITGGNG